MNKEEQSVNAVIVSGILQASGILHTATGKLVSHPMLTLITGSKDSETNKPWVCLELWQGLATKAAALPKDSLVRITGRLRTACWKDKETGQTRYKTEIVADSLEPVSSLQAIPIPKEKPSAPRKMGGVETAAAILSPASSEITEANPITDSDIPF